MVVLSALFSFYTVRLDLDLDPRRGYMFRHVAGHRGFAEAL